MRRTIVKRIIPMLVVLSLIVMVSCLRPGKHQSAENRGLWIEIQPDASIRLLDKMTSTDWDLGAPLLVKKDGTEAKVQASGEVTREGNVLSYGVPGGTKFHLMILDNPPSVEYSFEPAGDVKEVRLLDRALPLTEGEDNYYAVPHRLGILMRAEGKKPYSRRFRGYNHSGYTMAMFGAVHNGSALLVDWEDPYTDIVVDYTTTTAEGDDPMLTASLCLRKSARSVRLRPLGKAGYVEIAKAYREVAKQRGFLKTLAEKVAENPKVEKFFGSADFKPFAYMRRVPNTRWNKSSKTVYTLNFTFEECARLAEHFHNDLGIKRSLLVLNGWINAGYDNKHPDVLPAAPPMGGNKGLAACARRVKALGWLFGLHDNYQDMYRDAPSWDERYLIKKPDGTPHKGGVWAGGQCYLICSRESVKLASRPQNVPGVVKICSPDVYFSDTIFASPLYECYDPNHPETLVDDLHYKQKLCDYLRGEVGLFGSEEGREWGVAHADYFEGLLSHKTGFNNHHKEDIIIPLFELVYGDAIPIYTHQSDRPRPDQPEKILHHILYAEMPVYFFGNHIYWKDPSQNYKPKNPSKILYAQGNRFGLIDQFIKNTYEVLAPLNRLTALLPMTDHEFLSVDRQVERTRFGDDVEIVVNYGVKEFTVSDVTLPQYGFLVNSPKLIAYCATRYHGVNYKQPSLFVIRAEDAQPIASSGKIAVYHGFGSPRVEVNGEIYEIETERVLSAR